MNPLESPEAIAGLDDLLASAGLEHGRRKTLAGTWASGERVRQAIAKGSGPEPGTGQRSMAVQRVTEWKRYPWLRHGFSTRAGGVSSIYGPGSLNLGWTTQDSAANVTENRARFLAEVAGGPAILVGLRQIHSGLVRVIEQRNGGLREQIYSGPQESADGRPVLQGDAVMTDVPGVMLGVGVADCVPVLVADVRRRAVAAFHAGWRGTLARIVERGIGTMRLQYGSRPQDLVAVIGPSIGGCCYSVGEEVQFQFESQFAYAPELFSEAYDSDPVRERYPLLFLTARAPGHSNIGPQIHLDLGKANRRQLRAAGVPDGRITVMRQCTACTREGSSRMYFSHRGESGFAGRMMGLVGIAKAVNR